MFSDSIDLIFSICFSLLSMDVLPAQENSTTNIAARELGRIAVVHRDDFSWPRTTEQDTLVVFLGDSITPQVLYTHYLENFFYTRYPSLGIRFRNAGVAEILLRMLSRVSI